MGGIRERAGRKPECEPPARAERTGRLGAAGRMASCCLWGSWQAGRSGFCPGPCGEGAEFLWERGRHVGAGTSGARA